MTGKDWRDGLPYRPNVGICLINSHGKIWVGKGESSGPEIVEPGREWQMPQGGIDDDRDIVEAAKRELFEETGARTVETLAVTEDWWTYDFPIQGEPPHKLAPFCGQTQRWVLFRFTGDDSEFDISAQSVDEPAEFFEWRWADPQTVVDRVVPFKYQQYSRVLNAFLNWL
ncbi:MAG: RNA pyrophosphohydrolase [Pseudomonadota bacterium]